MSLPSSYPASTSTVLELNVSSLAAVVAMSKHPHYRSERFSLRTMNSVWWAFSAPTSKTKCGVRATQPRPPAPLCCRYHDEGSINVMWGYWKAHRLEPGSNIIAHHFNLIGLPGWIPESQEVVGHTCLGRWNSQPTRCL